MHIPNDSNRDVSQVWFRGSHHDLGINEHSGTGLVNIALAWMISEMLAIGIRFEMSVLERQFPRWCKPTPADNHNAAIHSTWTIIFKATGYNARLPGSFGLAGLKTNEKVHQSSRSRLIEDDQIIPGHVQETNRDVVPVWDKTRSWEENGIWIDDKSGWCKKQPFMDRVDLEEAEMNSDEKRLLGWGL